LLGLADGLPVIGPLEGVDVGDSLGFTVGFDVVGNLLGLADGLPVIGPLEGVDVGDSLGFTVGFVVVGDLLGLSVVGVDVSLVVGLDVGVDVALPDLPNMPDLPPFALGLECFMLHTTTIYEHVLNPIHGTTEDFKIEFEIQRHR
jgi:hypothetical protein